MKDSYHIYYEMNEKQANKKKQTSKETNKRPKYKQEAVNVESQDQKQIASERGWMPSLIK